MSAKLISRSADLARLQGEGYELTILGGSYLLVTSVPYVNSRREIAYGKLGCPLTLGGDTTQYNGDHVIHFQGEFPCDPQGHPLTALVHNSPPPPWEPFPGQPMHHSFSNKPTDGYRDYHHKITQYVAILSAQAQAIDPTVTAKTFKVTPTSEEDSVFLYPDTATTRAGIGRAANKLAQDKVAIIGLGGTGAYVLDLVAKAPVREIHLFDGDHLLSHNAFRTPGAPSLDELNQHPMKVAHFAGIYSKMRRGVVPHPTYLDDTNLALLHGFNFAFVCVDNNAARGAIIDALRGHGIPFIDVGMGLELLGEHDQLLGTCRVTLGTPTQSSHLSTHIPTGDDGIEEVYRSNIQIADLNALNAALAVIKWKKHAGFYQDLTGEYTLAYAINTNQLSSGAFHGD